MGNKVNNSKKGNITNDTNENEIKYQEIIPYDIPKWKIKKLENKLKKEKEKEKEKDKDKNTNTKEKSNFLNINKITGENIYLDIRKVYKFKDILGGGNFGTVRIGIKKENNEKLNKKFAIKSVKKTILKENDLETLMKEIEIISNLDHPNIIKFFETYQDNSYFHIVMELCTGKEVFNKIVENSFLTESKTIEIIYKVLSAINYCHKKGISHRDIKPENILFENNEPDSDIKIIDFGLSRKYNLNQKMHTILGTPYYVAPEVLIGEYDEKCDIWSIGATTYTMLSGDPPFTGRSNNDIFNSIINKEISFEKERWKKISKEGKLFIIDLMQKNPEKRPNAEKALEHIWFKNFEVILNESVNDFNNNSNNNKESKSNVNSSNILLNIKNFHSIKTFKRFVLKTIINSISINENDLKNIKKFFNKIDKNHNGQIDIQELKLAFIQADINITEEEIKKILSYMDEKEKLDYSEFIVISLNFENYLDNEKLISAFEYFDIDNSGYIDTVDIENFLLRSGKKITNSEDIDKMLIEISDNKKPIIYLKEFLKLFEIDINNDK